MTCCSVFSWDFQQIFVAVACFKCSNLSHWLAKLTEPIHFARLHLSKDAVRMVRKQAQFLLSFLHQIICLVFWLLHPCCQLGSLCSKHWWEGIREKGLSLDVHFSNDVNSKVIMSLLFPFILWMPCVVNLVSNFFGETFCAMEAPPPLIQSNLPRPDQVVQTQTESRREFLPLWLSPINFEKWKGERRKGKRGRRKCKKR